ncbi:MAG TPA: hypothetical protein VGQ83_41575 [Polyangia bacterium]
MRSLVVLALMLAASGCLTQHAVSTQGEESCTACHGDPNNFPGDNVRSAAPPQAVHVGLPTGATDPANPGVGAHQAHLKPNPFTTPIECSECHVVPTRDGRPASDVPGHLDGPRATVTFGGRATLDGVAATYDPATNTCTTYCHGTTLAGGRFPRPTWTAVGQGQGACGSCHGLPPTNPGHPKSGECWRCHPDVDESLTITDLNLHMNGTVDVISGLAQCDSCHGSAANPAPPVDTEGRSDTTLRSVGAHQAHVTEGPVARAFACTACHPMPDPDQPFVHIDGLVALVWGDLAQADGASPSFDGARCSNYCHGQTLTGGGTTAPQWTMVNGTQAACGTCHGLPPAAPHPQSTRCSLCHPTVDANLAFVQKDLHVNGTPDLITDTSCNHCHGSADNPAPPVDTHGRSDTTLVSVGAHQSHLAPDPSTAISAPVACAACHPVPDASEVFTHVNGTVALVFGTLANAHGAAATFDGTTCSNYCHGQTLSAGTNPTPQWNVVNGTEAVCGSCHGLPPTANGHPARTDCEACHGSVAGSGLTIQNPAKHINGTIDF